VSISRLTKALFIVHRDERKPFLRFIQGQGTVQITELKRQEVRAAFPELTCENSHRVGDLTILTSQIDFALKFLAPYGPKRSLLAALSPEELKGIDDLDTLADSVDIRELLDRVMRLSRDISEAKNTIARLRSARDTSIPWLTLNAPIESLRDTKSSHQMLFLIFRVAHGDICRHLDAVGDAYALTPVTLSRDYSYYHFLCYRDDRGIFDEALSKLGAQRENLPDFAGTTREYYDFLTREIRGLRKKSAALEKDARILAKDRKMLEALYDHYTIERQREEVSEKLDSSAGATSLEGWIPREKVDAVKAQIHELFRLVVMSDFEPSENEQPPILLKNSAPVRPFEVITSLYGMPDSNEFDPTPFFTLFYAIFFGTCLTDAGYGVVLSIILFLLVFGFRYSLGRNKIIQVLLIGSVSTIIMGALVGGWFGDLLFKLPDGSWLKNLGTSIIVIDPLKDTIDFMLFCIALGMIQINMGMLIGFAKYLKAEEYREAYVKMSWVVFIDGAAVLIAQYMSPGMIPLLVFWASAAAVILASLGIVFFSNPEKNMGARIGWGLYNLYGCTGYVGDVLSYLRLLALGLSTGIIATVVNLVAGLVWTIPYVGVVLAPLVFVGGHAFNIAINCLGAFVHTTRLQYVEFFSKFYEGSGKPFRPFGVSPRYVFLKEAVD
jgi:V/A-type H+/Na+-transporting ATPase subunit I